MKNICESFVVAYTVTFIMLISLKQSWAVLFSHIRLFTGYLICQMFNSNDAIGYSWSVNYIHSGKCQLIVKTATWRKL